MAFYGTARLVGKAAFGIESKTLHGRQEAEPIV